MQSVQNQVTTGTFSLPNGTAGMMIPLPVSAGRGLAPKLALHYSSAAGNSVFGMGWQLPILQISRRTRQGVPDYTAQDEFLGPQGEVLVPERDAQGTVVTRTCDQYGSVALAATYQVTRYFPRVEHSFDRIECWAPEGDPDDCFWLIHAADGQLHCLGKTALGRTSVTDATNKLCIAEWNLEETVSPTGEHVLYRYQAEDDAGVELSGAEAVRQRGALSYLVEVCYGNREPAQDLYLWDTADAVGWLFHLVFDYGARTLATDELPDYDASGDWLARQDPFSDYAYGFEARCHRLCRQILMFHQFDELGTDLVLVKRLVLDYAQSPILSQLVSSRLWAYTPATADIPAQVDSLPPLDLRYAGFNAPDVADWHTWQSGVPGGDSDWPYQQVDLYGDGLPGLLYRGNQNGWLYRAPVRDTQAVDSDAVAYQPWQTLARTPSFNTQVNLLDLRGSGQADWLLAQPGLAGFYRVQPDQHWSGFTPLRGLPNEYFQPQVLFADILGAGRTDLILLEPQCVRWYPNQGDGFGAAQSQVQTVILPVPGRDPSARVLFADILGSGQQHLVQVRYNQVTCWPNLGRGRFGEPLRFALTGLVADTFRPEHLYLADLDGSGAADLIYAEADRLRLYRNQSGNDFAEPVSLDWPDGVQFDRLCQLSFTDLHGQGTLSAVLSVPYADSQHWCYDFCQAKPYLLIGLNNNMGVDHRLIYRSSVQYWLDRQAQEPTATNALPFPIQTVAAHQTEDEISGNQLTQIYAYDQGYYDPVEREFRGFGLVVHQDTDSAAQGNSATAEAVTPPQITRTWYHTGREQDENTLAGQPWAGDADSYPVTATRLTQWDTQQDQTWQTPDNDSRYWLYRALRGAVLRQEIYGRDGTAQATLPYQVQHYRYQVRQCQAGQGTDALVALPLQLEQLSYHYERIATDPQCAQTILLAANEYGQPTWQANLNYPRRPAASTNPYPTTLPATTVDSSYDDQQQSLRLEQDRYSYHQLTDPTAWQLGVPDAQRQDKATYAASVIPADGFNYEQLTDPDGLSAQTPQAARFAGQTTWHYVEQPPTSLPVLPEHTETAQLDEAALAAYADLPPATLTNLLTQAGYQQADIAFESSDDTEQIWVAAHDFVTYAPAVQFYLPLTRQTSQLIGAMQFSYNTHGLPEQTIDALGNTETILAWDYHAVQPVQWQDHNNNMYHVALNAFGQTIARWHYGTEQGDDTLVGFTDPQPQDYAPSTVEDLVQKAQGDTLLTVAERYAIDRFSWMDTVSTETVQAALPTDIQLTHLVQERLLIPDPTDPDQYRVTARACRWITGDEPIAAFAGVTTLADVLSEATVEPPHGVHIRADRYPDPDYYQDGGAQHCQVTLRYHDGFLRPLQDVLLDSPGEAQQVDGSASAYADPRWAASGRVEYDNKGETIRQYQPYFINDWHYADQASLQAQGYADSYYRDPLGREIQVATAAGYQRSTAYYPWFMVEQDENDTSGQTDDPT